MGGLVAGIGLRAVLGSAASKAASGAASGLKAAGTWFSHRTPLELIGVVALAIAVWQHFSLVHARHALTASQAQTTAYKAQAAQAVKALANSQANEMKLRAEIADTNKRITDQSHQLATEQDQLSQARRKGAQSIAGAKATGQRLAASSRQKPPPGEDCGPSGAEKGKWS